ncbi:MAG: hypothetical protein EAZ85_10025 [Bacteroidetes bacterium]|nr:MAG: hypothetical protein EAZ85_10025 [Bacteroidota bacterium]TAG86003.1 MAG: hypothetical protein EAZ20_13695 [Bacteroidota bacterium]
MGYDAFNSAKILKKNVSFLLFYCNIFVWLFVSKLNSFKRMKKIKVILLFIFFVPYIYAQDVSNMPELVPNPAFQVTGNEMKFNELIEKIGLKNIMLASAKKTESLKERLQKISLIDFREIKGWKLWENLNEERTTNTQQKKITLIEFNALLNISKPHFLSTFLAQKLERNKRYQVVFQFEINPKVNELPKEHLPSIGFCFTDNSPEDENKELIPQKDFSFKPDVNYAKYKKRQKVLENMGNDNGLQFQNKEWKDFLGIKDKKYEEISFEYIATGEEKYLIIGNFWAENDTDMPSIDIVLKKTSIKLIPDYKTK